MYLPRALFLVVIGVTIVGVVVTAGYLGLRPIPREPAITPNLAAPGVPPESQQSFDQRVVAALRARRVPDTAIIGIIDRTDLTAIATPDAMIAEFEAQAVRYEAVRQRLDVMPKIDEEVRSFAERAETELLAGNLPAAETRLSAAEFKNFILDQVAFHVVDDEIKFDNNWDRDNLVQVNIPQLRGLRSAVPNQQANTTVTFHRDAVEQLKGAFASVERLGLLSNIYQWCGSFAPRVIAGNIQTPSTHALGLAFDINCSGLPAGEMSAAQEAERVAAVVPVFISYGFIWGGDYAMPDPMHFQVMRFLSPVELAAVDLEHQ